MPWRRRLFNRIIWGPRKVVDHGIVASAPRGNPVAGKVAPRSCGRLPKRERVGGRPTNEQLFVPPPPRPRPPTTATAYFPSCRRNRTESLVAPADALCAASMADTLSAAAYADSSDRRRFIRSSRATRFGTAVATTPPLGGAWRSDSSEADDAGAGAGAASADEGGAGETGVGRARFGRAEPLRESKMKRKG